MHTYEKPPGNHHRNSNYTGLIAVICLFTALFATWALIRATSHETTSLIATSGMAQNNRTQ
jgi:hypothetical protein